MRELRKVPRSKCWYVGSPEVDAVDIACEFNKSWETDLRVGRHDCRDYTNGNYYFVILMCVCVCVTLCFPFRTTMLYAIGLSGRL